MGISDTYLSLKGKQILNEEKQLPFMEKLYNFVFY